MPDPEQVLVRVRYSACCATDFDLIDGTMPDQARYPIVLGHEWSGEIVEATEAGLLIDGHDYYGAFFRAARQAEHYLLISGWQFDSEARLLFGDEAQGQGEVRFLPFLHALCEQKPGLRVYILAWDFSVVYAAEREWFQQWRFNWMTHERLQFRMDSAHPLTGAQHHKLVIVDGLLRCTGDGRRRADFFHPL